MRILTLSTLCLFLLFIPYQAQAECPNPNTLKNKIMAGYQGWFQAEDNWRHWTKKTNGSYLPTKDNLTFDLWPDMTEYQSSSLSEPIDKFQYSDGSDVSLFSSDERETANLHLKWIKDYEIDGVFVQRFALEAFKIRQFRDDVLTNVRYAAENNCRVFANMYDISDYNKSKNDNKSLEQALKEDWGHLVNDLGITDSSQYLMHNGKPVVAIWGFGVDDRRTAIAGANEAKRIIQWFKDQNVTVMGGIDGKFLDDSNEWKSVYEQFDIVSPWNVGRYRSASSFDRHYQEHISPQKKWAEQNNRNFLPVVFPGFSWSNLKETGELNKIPRLGGEFYWHQLRSLINNGHDMIYVAMFDEVDEGTAIFKVAASKEQVPTQLRDNMLTLDHDGYKVPSDWYLILTGLATRGLRSGYLEDIPNATDFDQDSLRLLELIEGIHEDSLVIFDFDDTLYMNGDRNPEEIAPHWASFASKAVHLIHSLNINIAICSANGNKGGNLQARLRELNPKIFIDEFFQSGAFLTGSPNDAGDDCNYEKDNGIKSLLDHFEVKDPRHVLMFDDSERNFSTIKNSQKLSGFGVRVNKIHVVSLSKEALIGGLNQGKFEDGIEHLRQSQIAPPLLTEGQGDCDNSQECAGNLVCMNSVTGETEEKNSNDNGFTFVVETEINQPGDETCEYPEEPVLEIPLLQEGQGDCDNSQECAGNLVCLNSVTGETEEKNSNDNGFTFVVETEINQPGDETCEYLPEPVPEIILLQEGQGDCDNSQECAGDLVCLNSVTGETEEKNSNDNGFTFVVDTEVNQPGDETCEYLPEIILLQEGQGDCDNSQECAGDLVCLNSTTGKTEEKNSNEHGFTFVVETEINQPGDETCEYPDKNDHADEDIKYAANTLVVKHDNKWHFVYCSGTKVKVSRDWSKKQTWVKHGTRNLGVLNGPKLYCPEKEGGYAPTKCTCENRHENYHEKRKADKSKFEDNVSAPAKISQNEEIFIGPNNNMNACLKLLKKNSDSSLRIHAPCALEPWKTNQKCSKGGDYNALQNEYSAVDGSNASVHELDCNEFRLND
ncbi:MAG: hypothetical protein HRU09_05655 [Oligoflexales bacterium]|nr:hypothetical protein [Oligoflexales bacterium]